MTTGMVETEIRNFQKINRFEHKIRYYKITGLYLTEGNSGLSWVIGKACKT